MATFEDKKLQLHNNTDDDKRDFQIAWLHRRAENLEAIVFELLRGRVPDDAIKAYADVLQKPGWVPSSGDIKDRGQLIASQIKIKD